MVQFTLSKLKDLGLQREVMDALPYAVVGGAYEGSMETSLPAYDPTKPDTYKTVLSHVVPAGHQLKILFLRVWTQDSGGAVFSIVQTNPTDKEHPSYSVCQPVVGSVPEGVRDYPMLEAAGAEVLHGSLKDPIHVLEGSIDFRIHGPVTADADLYGVVYWGVEKISE